MHNLTWTEVRYVKTGSPKCHTLQDVYRNKAYKEQGYEVISIGAKFSGKAIVGLGTKSAHEYGMTFHHTLGIPYIPGQAIKGVCRNYYIQSAFNGSEETALEDPMFQSIFGYSSDIKARMGDVIFMDAYSASGYTIANDIINNHYPEYYENWSVSPANYLNPRPLNFLTICQKEQEGKYLGVKFRYSFAVRPEKIEKLESALYELIKNAFCEVGIGAKTSVGYGQFSKTELENTMNSIRNDKLKLKKEYERARIVQEEGEIGLEMRALKEIQDETEKNEAYAVFFNKWGNDKENCIKAARFYKDYLISTNRWVYKEKKKPKKLYEKIKKICEILEEEMPIN